MHVLRDAETEALKAMLGSQPHTSAKIGFAWRVAAGAALARATQVSWSDGILFVRARGGDWAREVRHARPMIAERLNHLVGPGVVKSIRVIEG